MLSSLKELGTYLENTIERYVPKRQEQKEIAITCQEKHGLPARITYPILAFSKTVEDLGDFGCFVGYVILEAINERTEDKIKFDEYFTEQEIKTFSSSQYEDKSKAEFPIVFSCIEVAPDQWIGSVDAQTLINFGRCGLIHYEADTQRALKKIVRGENVFYKISLDLKALQGIEEQYKNGSYIPNTITLNIPEGVGDFFYDKDRKELIINNLEAFNITDGYHRYRGLVSVINDNPDFNCNMEIRITNFSVEKAESFIWQEDKKTKMRKVDSASYNMNDLSNRITKRINTSADSNIAGLLSRTEGNINFGEFSSCVNYYYIKNSDTKNQQLTFINVSKQIIKFFNYITETNPGLFLEKQLEFKDLTILFFLSVKYQDNLSEDIVEKYIKMKERLLEKGSKKFSIKEMRKVLEKELIDIYNEVR